METLGCVVGHKEIPRHLWVDPLNLKAARDVAPVPAQVTFVKILYEWISPFPHFEEVTEGILTCSAWHDGMNRHLETVHVTGESMTPVTEYTDKVNLFFFRNNGNGGDITYHFNAPEEYRDMYEYMGVTIAPTCDSWFPKTRLLLKLHKYLVKTLEEVLRLIDAWKGGEPFLRPKKYFESLESYLAFMGEHEAYTGGGGYVACARFLKSQGYAPLADIEI